MPGAAIKGPSVTRLMVRWAFDKYVPAGSSPADAPWQLGAQLPQKAADKLHSCGLWCKEVLRQYPLHKLPVPSVLKASLQQAQGALSQCHHPAPEAARPIDAVSLLEESLACKAAVQQR